MAQLNVRELRKQKQQKKGNVYNFLNSVATLKSRKMKKRFAKAQRNISRALVTLAATVLISMSNILVTIQTLAVVIYLRKRSRERSHVMTYIIPGCGSDDDLCQTFPFLLSIINLQY